MAAAPHFARALELDPIPRALVHYGAHLEAAGNAAGAVDQVSKAFELAPNDTRVVEAWLGLLLRQGRNLDLLATAEAIIARAPGLATAHYHKGAALAGLRRGRQAETELLEARRLDPSGSRAQAALGALLQARGDAASALPLLREALRNGRFANARRQEEQTWRMAVSAALDLGDREMAREIAADCERRRPESALAADLRRIAEQ